MKIIRYNPYRVVGILSNATTKELEKQKGKIKAYTRVGKEIRSDLDFQVLGEISRTEESVNNAFSKIEQNQDKVSYSLFWFLNISPFDHTAIEYLKIGDEEKALEIWEKVTNDKDVNSKNFSAFNNLGTFKLLSKNKADLKAGIEAKIKLIESVYFEMFVHLVADETYTIDKQKLAEKLIDELLKQFKGQFSTSEILQLFSDCNRDLQHYLSIKFTEEPLHNIESQIDSCKKKRKTNKGNAYEYGLRLYTNTKNDLGVLKSLLTTSDLKYKTVADQLANEIMQCGIDYFNESQENETADNYLEFAQKLTKLADSIAVGKLTKDRAKDSLVTLEDMKDRDLNQAIEILNSIKLAYEKAISEIDAQVIAMMMTMSKNQTINYTKVAKVKENCLNWDKVVEVVINGISVNSVSAIQNCSNQTKISEYKNLVDFLISKLGPIQINQIKHICYWKDVKAAQAVSTVKNVGRTIRNTTDGCYIATMAYGDYDHPQVLALRGFRDEILSKTIIGRSFIKLYYNHSPRLVERLKNRHIINLIIRKGLDQLIKAIKK